MFKYGRMQKKIPFQLVCGFHSVSLECMLLGVQVTTGLGLFLHLNCLEGGDFLLNRPSPLSRSPVKYCTGKIIYSIYMCKSN